MKYRIILIQCPEARRVSGELEELYQSSDIRIALAASKQMRRLLHEYDSRLQHRCYFLNSPPLPSYRGVEDSGGTPVQGSIVTSERET